MSEIQCVKCKRSFPSSVYASRTQVRHDACPGCRRNMRAKIHRANTRKPKNLKPVAFAVWNCTHCKKEYPLSKVFFHKNKHSKTGFTADCKTCRTIKLRACRAQIRAENLEQGENQDEDSCLMCTGCNQMKPANKFGKNNNTRVGRRARCRECRSNENKIRHREYSEFIRKHRDKHPCVDCGESDPDVLTSDHVLGVKLFNIAEGCCYSEKAVVEELKKCVSRCGICHEKQTQKRRSAKKPTISHSPSSIHQKGLAQLMTILKFQIGECEICWLKVPSHRQVDTTYFDFDHLFRETKNFGIGQAIWDKREFAEIFDELSKVRLLCRNCHLRVTAIQRGWNRAKPLDEEKIRMLREKNTE